jgi:hypothetical protein
MRLASVPQTCHYEVAVPSLCACSRDSIWALSASAIARPAAAVLCW